MYSDSDFTSYQVWSKQTTNSYDHWGRYPQQQQHMVIDWVLQNNKDIKDFLGYPAGRDPHNKNALLESAQAFLDQFESWQKAQDQAKEKLFDDNDLQEGKTDGFFLQPKRKKQNEGYLKGYRSGLSLRREQGYIVSETEEGAYGLNLG